MLISCKCFAKSIFHSVCSFADRASSSVAVSVTEITTSAAQSTGLTVTKKNDVSLSTVSTTNYTQQPPTTTQQITSAVISEKVSSSPPPLTSPQTPKWTEETHPSPPPQTTMSEQTSTETVSHGPSVKPGSESPNVTTTNTTIPG